MFKLIGKAIKYGIIGFFSLVVLMIVVVAIISDDDNSTSGVNDAIEKNEAFLKEQGVKVETKTATGVAPTPSVAKQSSKYITMTLPELREAEDALADSFNSAAKVGDVGKLERISDEVDILTSEIEIREKRQQRDIKSQVERQFSSWDGSHRAFVKIIKNNMHDPSSFDHVETKYRVEKDTGKVFVRMKYRGKNAFGGVILNQNSAYFDLEGNFIELVE